MKIIKKINLILLVCFFMFSLVSSSYSQCAMCRATVESNATTQQGVGKGLNSGILYLMIVPYILIGGLGYLWYINSKKETEKQNRIFSILKKKLT